MQALQDLSSQASANRVSLIALAFFVFGLGILIYLSLILYSYPLFSFATHDIGWSNAWLYMTVLDYYGAALCLAAIALSSEPIVLGLCWSVGFCLLGSPVCCAYIVYRCLIFQNLSLDDSRSRNLHE